MTTPPEPGDGRLDPNLSAIMSERRRLINLTPAERVAFILLDVFCHSFAEVAEIVGHTPAACRHLASSARRRIRAARAPAAPTAQQADIVRGFKQAWEAKDTDALIGLLDPDATAIADGGGLASAVLPRRGSDAAPRARAGRPCRRVGQPVPGGGTPGER